MRSRTELLTLVTILGREFRRLGMAAHMKRLRLYFLAVKHGLTTAGNDVELSYTEDEVLEWMRTLKVPPFDKAAAPSAPARTAKTSGGHGPR